MEKSRWLKIDATNQECYNNMMALIKTIEHVEVKELEGKTYVRFYEDEIKVTKTQNHQSYFLTNFYKKHMHKAERRNNIRNYCAVILK